MSLDFHNQYAELISDLKTYISEEYPAASSIVTSPENYAYFRDQAKQIQALSNVKVSINSAPPQTAVLPAVNSNGANLHEATSPIKSIPVTSTAEIETATKPKASSRETVNPIAVSPAVPPEKMKINSNLKREPLENEKYTDFSNLRKLWEEQCPNHHLIETPPSDDQAKATYQRWQAPAQVPDIALLYFGENPRERVFLTNIAAAISQCLAPAGLMSASTLENEGKWNKWLSAPNLKLVIAHHHSLYTLPELSQLYNEDSVRGNHTLGRVPLLLLSDLSLYMREPQLKISLWQSLCLRLTKKR